jgi:hypothetical protein
MSGPAIRSSIGITFNAGLCFGLHYLGGMSASVTWLTFLLLMGFVGMAEVYDEIREVRRMLEDGSHSPK